MNKIKYQYDVFVSYSHQDYDWVLNKLLPSLEKAKLRVCIDVRDFDRSVPFVTNIQNAVERSRFTVLVISPGLQVSEFRKFEEAVARTSDPASRRGRLLPIMLYRSELPPHTETVPYIDMTNPETVDQEMQRLIRTLQSERRRPKRLSDRRIEMQSPDRNLQSEYSSLHDRFTRGEELTAEEQETLERWYAEQDRAEAAQLGVDSASTDTAALKAQVTAALVRLKTVSGEIQQLAEGNETLRREIAALRRQLAQESRSKAA